jgi:hypothetical protein
MSVNVPNHRICVGAVKQDVLSTMTVKVTWYAWKEMRLNMCPVAFMKEIQRWI